MRVKVCCLALLFCVVTTYQCGILAGVGVNFDLKKHQIPVRLQYR